MKLLSLVRQKLKNKKMRKRFNLTTTEKYTIGYVGYGLLECIAAAYVLCQTLAITLQHSMSLAQFILSCCFCYFILNIVDYIRSFHPVNNHPNFTLRLLLGFWIWLMTAVTFIITFNS